MGKAISTYKRIELVKLLKKKRNVDKFMKRRTIDFLATELGVSTVTLTSSFNTVKTQGALSPDQIDHAKRMFGEREKHWNEFKRDWTLDGIAERVGVSYSTVKRQYDRTRYGTIRP